MNNDLLAARNEKHVSRRNGCHNTLLFMYAVRICEINLSHTNQDADEKNVINQRNGTHADPLAGFECT